MQEMLLRAAEVILQVFGRWLVRLVGPVQGLQGTGNAFRMIYLVPLFKSKYSLGFGQRDLYWVASVWKKQLLFLINLHLLMNCQIASVSGQSPGNLEVIHLICFAVTWDCLPPAPPGAQVCMGGLCPVLIMSRFALLLFSWKSLAITLGL